jgi:hypothetical protein
MLQGARPGRGTRSVACSVVKDDARPCGLSTELKPQVLHSVHPSLGTLVYNSRGLPPMDRPDSSFQVSTRGRPTNYSYHLKLFFISRTAPRTSSGLMVCPPGTAACGVHKQ